MQSAKDKEDFKRQIQELVEENQRLRSRSQAFEKGSKDEEPRFSTPEEQNSRLKPGTEDEDSAWLHRCEVEEREEKEAARPPFLPEASRNESNAATSGDAGQAFSRQAQAAFTAEFKTPKEAARPPQKERAPDPFEAEALQRVEMLASQRNHWRS